MTSSQGLERFQTNNEFQARHIGPSENEVKEMLRYLGFQSLEELAAKVIPSNIRTQHEFKILGEGLSESQTLGTLRTVMAKNEVFRSFIGLGYYDTITPSPILRHVFENAAWYTAYTPYQPEISQGRLQALLNFQTMVADLTGMEIANSSLLDEGTAAAEAMFMAYNLSKTKAQAFLASGNLHPHVLQVLATRAEPLGIKMIVGEAQAWSGPEEIFAAIVSVPGSNGVLPETSGLRSWCDGRNARLIVDTDLLALTLIRPPGEWGADIVIGNSQRFGVPLGNGGPHAAFIATKDAHKRLLPGRLVGVSVDSHGNQALRLTLQTREQHIRREKATSNICTAQVLLANMASMYAVYHGPQGLKKIASRVHGLALTLADGLRKLGFKLTSKAFFDTVCVETPLAKDIGQRAENCQINFRIEEGRLVIALDETSTLQTVTDILGVFQSGKANPLELETIARSLPEFGFPEAHRRTTGFLEHPNFNSYHSETELLRYIYELASRDITLTRSMIPLGSCTMKLNAATELLPVSWPTINKIHPFSPEKQRKGYAELARDLEAKLSDITGFPGISLQPNAGSQGEYAGLLAIYNYYKSRGESQRRICLIPSSAHGTNPASAVLVGFQVVVVECDANGNVDVADLQRKAAEHSDQLAALMITYPSTHGVFESAITEICDIIHKAGGQVYMDGANLNALVGLCRPGEFGPDVCHMNLHKTFAIPHGGGGPGVGPIGVAKHLIPFLPGQGTGQVTSAPLGSASILPISWSYITMMGFEGLRKATLVAILNANYVAHRLKDNFPILYRGKEGLVGHECILDLRPHKKDSGVEVNDVAKRLMDFGFHAPTMSFPVPGTFMVEPTESESKAELDRFVEAMLAIAEEITSIAKGQIQLEASPLRQAPHTHQALMKSEWALSYSREQAAYPAKWVRANKYWPPVGRVDNAYGDRHVVCSCPPVSDFQ